MKLVSVLLPAFNEEAILTDNLHKVAAYMASLGDRYATEIIIINDGSSDATGELAEACAAQYENVRVIHHERNGGLGVATKTGIENASGDYVVILDIDLSYDTDHIGEILATLDSTNADIVLASPYMRGGTIENVPAMRRTFSIAANRFLSTVAHGNISTLTCMVRGFRGDFARSLVLRSTGMDVMPETIYKSMILRGRIIQIPARLKWGEELTTGERKSSMRILRQIFGTLLSGFLFRPFMFFILPGLLMLIFSSWVNVWMIIHFFEALSMVPEGVSDSTSWAIATAYREYPHTFIVGLLSLMLAIQMISLGILALQNKSYFEEIFYLGTSIAKNTRANKNPTQSHYDHTGDIG